MLEGWWVAWKVYCHHLISKFTVWKYLYSRLYIVLKFIYALNIKCPSVWNGSHVYLMMTMMSDNTKQYEQYLIFRDISYYMFNVFGVRFHTFGDPPCSSSRHHQHSHPHFPAVCHCYEYCLVTPNGKWQSDSTFNIQHFCCCYCYYALLAFLLSVTRVSFSFFYIPL